MIGLFDPILRAVSADKMMEHVRLIWDNNRYFDFTHFRQTADYVEAAIKEYGLQAERMELPADGETRYGDAVVPLAWDCESAEIALTAPMQRVLATYSDCPNCVGMWCPPTPPEGVEAQVLCLPTGDAGELEIKEAKGLFIYTPGRADAIRDLAIKKEAAGIVSSWTPAPANKDSVQWISRNSGTPGGWGTRKDEPQILTLAVSPRAGADIAQISKEGSATLRVKVQSRLYAGGLPVLSTLIPGDPGEEEVLLYTPLYGQGAHFSASTVAALLEAARVLTSQVEAGAMPKPWRGIRLLFGPKLYGTLAFAREHKEILQRTCFALYLEAGAGNPDISWSRWSYRFTPINQRHFSDGLAWKLFHLYLQHWRPQRFLETPGVSLTGDVILNDPLIGVPTHWLYGGTSEECRNSSADVIETVDSRSLIDLAAASLAMAYTTASVGNGDVPDLAVWNYHLSQERFRDDLQIFIDRVKETRGLNDLNELLGEASRHFELRVEMEAKALRSLSQLGEEIESQVDWESAIALIHGLEGLGKSAIDVIRAHINVRADELNVPAANVVAAENPPEDERVPVRIGEALGTITLDSLPFADWSTPVKTSPRSNLPYILAWWLIDGERTIGQIQRLLHFEAIRYRECIPAWFNFLEKHGYVVIRDPKGNEEEKGKE